jgi:hypothetical protein
VTPAAALTNATSGINPASGVNDSHPTVEYINLHQKPRNATQHFTIGPNTNCNFVALKSYSAPVSRPKKDSAILAWMMKYKHLLP